MTHLKRDIGKKLTVVGNEFHTFTTLDKDISAYCFYLLRLVQLICVTLF